MFYAPQMDNTLVISLTLAFVVTTPKTSLYVLYIHFVICQNTIWITLFVVNLVKFAELQGFYF